MSTATKTRSILINKTDGSRVLVDGIPTNAKITFGPVAPGTKDYDRTRALRVYTTANNQLAVFLNVESFRDLSLTVKEQKVRKVLKSDAQAGPNGRFSEESYEVEYEWQEVQV